MAKIMEPELRSVYSLQAELYNRSIERFVDASIAGFSLRVDEHIPAPALSDSPPEHLHGMRAQRKNLTSAALDYQLDLGFCAIIVESNRLDCQAQDVLLPEAGVNGELDNVIHGMGQFFDELPGLLRSMSRLPSSLNFLMP